MKNFGVDDCNRPGGLSGQFSAASEQSGTSKTNTQVKCCQRCFVVANAGKFVRIRPNLLDYVRKILSRPGKPPVSEKK